jgi:hypothetical protein
MKSQQTYRLIDGTFNPEEASAVLLSLVKSKMDFHQLQKTSSEERFGADVHQSGPRLIELKKLQEQLRALCQTAQEHEQTLKIHGWIEITVTPRRETTAETLAEAIS